MEKYKKADEKIASGYQYFSSDETAKACDVLLDAWEDIKAIMAEDQVRDLTELEEKYQWTGFLFNYVQDLEEQLHNACTENEQYLPKRIRYCEELLKVCGDKDELLIENTRRAIAESHYALGNEQECNRLYSKWLTSDPTWGWGYIGWSDCYHYGTKKMAANYVKAEEIISKALEEKDVKDRADVVDRAIEIYDVLENKQKVAELKKELVELTRTARSKAAVNVPVNVIKIGRNDPCPCGSGKKYKKCCGK
ncbi:YecA family protein [Phosphitispora fastidiosa]|uniref:YecA family protein n=1 Tax=Phosphitispora fastidiosa TaxID=2837202 RepID=UPI001E358B87|nr:SEC-C metal-binding domain-containing protein [Phosphitispora fastidiosa]MBU7006588.1 tetratricopeptide (TPR) repeat protein [Phosphitispora fastidiosa]